MSDSENLDVTVPKPLPTPLWVKASSLVVGAAAIVFPIFTARDALGVRLLENKNFASSFKNGAFEHVYSENHAAYSKTLRSTGLNELPQMLKDTLSLEIKSTKTLKEGGVSKWEAFKNLSPIQYAAGLISVAAGAWLISMAVKLHRRDTQNVEYAPSPTPAPKNTTSERVEERTQIAEGKQYLDTVPQRKESFAEGVLDSKTNLAHQVSF